MKLGGARIWCIAWVGLVSLLAATACSGDGDGGSIEREWACFESSECSCRVVEPNTVVGGSNPVDSCFDTSCCLLTQDSSSDGDAVCDCIVSDDCTAEARSRRSTEVVSQCPPPGEGPEVMAGECAAEGENCRRSYLEDNDLTGCCEGSICKANASGVPVCQAASEDELATFALCQRTERSNELDTLKLADGNISTSVGELTLDTDIRFVDFGAGPGGCVNELDVTVGGVVDCQLEFRTALVDGKLVLDYVAGRFEGCPGYTGEGLALALSGDEEIPGDVAVEAVACEASFSTESYCVAGRFALHLDGTIDEVMFNDVNLVIEGGICHAEPEGECPAG